MGDTWDGTGVVLEGPAAQAWAAEVMDQVAVAVLLWAAEDADQGAVRWWRTGAWAVEDADQGAVVDRLWAVEAVVVGRVEALAEQEVAEPGPEVVARVLVEAGALEVAAVVGALEVGRWRCWRRRWWRPWRLVSPELAARRPDVILAHGASAMGPLQQASRAVPIVCERADGHWFVDSLARPGEQRLRFPLSTAWVGKWLKLLKPLRRASGERQCFAIPAKALGRANSPPSKRLRDWPHRGGSSRRQSSSFAKVQRNS